MINLRADGGKRVWKIRTKRLKENDSYTEAREA
jgi:hypothetical protein